jgi:hypothetical protein
MPLPPFEPSGDLPEGIHQADVAEFFARFGSGTPQRERVSARLLQAFELIRPLGVISRVIVWGVSSPQSLSPPMLISYG